MAVVMRAFFRALAAGCKSEGLILFVIQSLEPVDILTLSFT